MKDVPGMKIKEGFFYYLDRLHRDHIEFFDARYKAIAVDGTVNKKKFVKAVGRSIKKCIKGK